MSDIHGRDDILEDNIERLGFPASSEDMLVLCGDYISHDWEETIDDLAAVMDIQSRFPEGQVICLAGNHEVDWAESYGGTSWGRAFARWIRELPLYFETENAIYVHAGIDEEAGDWWRTGTSDETFTHKFPPETGSWDDGSGSEKSKDIVAGHVGTSSNDLGGRDCFGCVYYDGEDHFFIDGTTEYSKVIPVLEYDTDEEAYYAWDSDGDRHLIASKRIED